MAALESLVPTDLEVHLQMNSSRFETYDAMRAEVLAFIESRTGSRMTETKVHKHDKIRDDPMDLDSVVKGKGKNKFSGSCYICGKVGHKSTECWSRDRASNKGSGRNQSANVTSSGKRQVSRARYRRIKRFSLFFCLFVFSFFPVSFDFFSFLFSFFPCFFFFRFVLFFFALFFLGGSFFFLFLFFSFLL